MYKKVKKHENTVFGYKKGSKTKSENLKIFFDPKLYIETFCIFEKNLILLDIFEFFGFSKDFVHFFSLTSFFLFFFFFLEFIIKKMFSNFLNFKEKLQSVLVDLILYV